MSSLPTGKPYARLSDFALDPTNVYESYAEAADYASASPLSYVGQILGVREGSTCNIYVIEPTRTLKRIGGFSDSGDPVLGYQAFEIGDVLWQDVSLPIPNGWLAAGQAFSISENPALHALYGTNTTPDYPAIDGRRPIILGHYVDNVRIPEGGFVEASGINQSKQEQLIAASNTIVAQMRYEDEERKSILATIGLPALASDDLPTLHARLKRCLARLSEKLSNKGIHEQAGASFETLIDRIDEIESTASSFRIESFTASEPLVLEKHANRVLNRLTLSWSYNNDTLLKYQTLSGPGGIAIDANSRSVQLSPNVKDDDYEFVLMACDTQDRQSKRSLTVRYVCPVYYGVTQTYEISPEEVVLGTKEVIPENSFHAKYRNVVGYMFLAVPEVWSPFVSAIDPHGFDYLRGSLRILKRTLTSPDGTKIPYRIYISRLYNTLDEYGFRFFQ